MGRDAVPCMCASDLCGHNGEQCGKRVSLTVETQTWQGQDQFGPRRKVGICEECCRGLKLHCLSCSAKTNRKTTTQCLVFRPSVEDSENSVHTLDTTHTPNLWM